MGKNKIPKLFRKKLKQKKWKNFLKHIYIPSDRKMVEGLYELQDDRMVIKEEIPSDILKKLKPLAKSIKSNKGMVTKWKGIILLVLTAAILVFTFFFKNMVIENAMETALEKVFQADADVINPRFSLFKGDFGFQGLKVQDKDKPGKNLFETGMTTLSINIPELTRNRFRIETMALEGFRLNTARESDTLEIKPREKQDSEALIDLSDLSSLSEDPAGRIEALINEQKENLKTLKFIEGANKELDDFTSRWEIEFNNSRKEVEDFTRKFSDIGSQGIPSVTSIEDGKALVTEYEGYYNEIKEKKKEVLALQVQFLEEKERLFNYKNEIEDMIQDDLAYLRGLLSLPDRGEMKDFVSDKIKEILLKRFQDYYDKAMKIMPYYEKFKNQEKNEEPAKKVNKRMTGRTILFPSPDNPKFLIESVRLTGGDETSGTFGMDLTGITSEPDKWADPVNLSSQWKSDSLEMTLQGFLDLKDDAKKLFNIQFESPENPISWKEGIPALGVDSAHAQLSYLGNSRPHPEKKGILVSLNMDFSEIEVISGDQDELVARILEETIQDINEFLVTAELYISADGIKSIEVKSDLVEILKERMGDLLKDLPQQGMEELEKVLRKMISENLLKSDKVNKALEALNIQSLDQIRSLEDLEGKLKEYEDQARGQADALIKEYGDKARAEAAKVKAEADRLLAEAEQKKKAAEAQAKAEAARVKAEADRLQAEAEQKKKEADARAQAQAKSEADKLKDKLKVPGF